MALNRLGPRWLWLTGERAGRPWLYNGRDGPETFPQLVEKIPQSPRDASVGVPPPAMRRAQFSLAFPRDER